MCFSSWSLNTLPPGYKQTPPAVSLERSCVGELRHPANSQHHLRSAQLFPVSRPDSYLFIYLCVDVCGCYSLTLGVSLSYLPPYIFEKGPLMSPVHLANQQVLRTCLSPPPCHPRVLEVTDMYHYVWKSLGPDLGPLAPSASSLCTESSPQPCEL